MDQDFVRVKVEVFANGEAADYTIIQPLFIGDTIPVEVVKTAAETGARVNFLRSMRSSHRLISRTGHVLDRRNDF